MKTITAKMKANLMTMGVLIVEDDENAATSLASIVRRMCSSCFVASNYLEAKELFEKHKDEITIVMSDIELGGKNGLELIKNLSQISDEIRFIVFSAYNTTRYFVEAIDLAVDSFLLKPLESTSIITALVKSCEKIIYQKELTKSHNKLERAKVKAQEMVAIQDKFIKDAIHEVYTPLSVIITNIDLIKMTHGNIKFLSSIEAACRVLQNSYEDMVYYAKLDKHTLKCSDIDLVEFLNQRVVYFETIALANEIKIECKMEVESFSVHISQTKLQRLIDNNISNAIKYANANSTVTISLKNCAGGVSLEFLSFGRVIADKNAVFKRFHREDGIKGGYGIGLSLVREICKNEGISYKVESSKQNGTLFCYTFKNQIQKVKK
jgi:two-component system, sensor histidine kinase and response regulator